MTREAAQKLEFDVDRVRESFPILSRDVRSKKLIYLDNAASTLKPSAVIERLTKYYQMETSNVHRGAHFLSDQGTLAYENARATVAKFIGASSPSEIVFTRGTTESINLVAHAFGKTYLAEGDEIIITELEHHSNIVPWQILCQERGCRLRVVPILESGQLNIDRYFELLNKKTKLVSVLWVSNAIGTVVPVRKFIEAAHGVGAKVFIDAAQAVAHFDVNVKELGCDFLAFSGHKIYGPYGIGVLYGKEEWLDSMAPYQTGGSMISEVSLEETTWAPVPQKFEAGTPSISGALGLASALDFLRQLGLVKAAEYESGLFEYANQQLVAIPGLQVYGQESERVNVISFNINGIHASDIGSLIDQEGVAIRTGHHCCQPLMKRLGVTATARASFAFYNTRDEIDRFVESLVKVKEFF